MWQRGTKIVCVDDSFGFYGRVEELKLGKTYTVEKEIVVPAGYDSIILEEVKNRYSYAGSYNKKRFEIKSDKRRVRCIDVSVGTYGFPTGLKLDEIYTVQYIILNYYDEEVFVLEEVKHNSSLHGGYMGYRFVDVDDAGNGA